MTTIVSLGRNAIEAKRTEATKPARNATSTASKCICWLQPHSEPVEFFLTPGSVGDVEGLDFFDFDLPEQSQIIGDKAYNDYELEDVLLTAADLHLLPMRKHNSKRPFPPWMRYLQAHFRKAVETTGSLLERLLPKSIHTVTAEGFELKLVLFVLALSISRLPICA